MMDFEGFSVKKMHILRARRVVFIHINTNNFILIDLGLVPLFISALYMFARHLVHMVTDKHVRNVAQPYLERQSIVSQALSASMVTLQLQLPRRFRRLDLFPFRFSFFLLSRHGLGTLARPSRLRHPDVFFEVL